MHGREFEIAWDACDQDGWGRLLAMAGRSSLEQSWAYGDALAATAGCRVHRAVVSRGETSSCIICMNSSSDAVCLTPSAVVSVIVPVG